MIMNYSLVVEEEFVVIESLSIVMKHYTFRSCISSLQALFFEAYDASFRSY